MIELVLALTPKVQIAIGVGALMALLFVVSIRRWKSLLARSQKYVVAGMVHRTGVISFETHRARDSKLYGEFRTTVFLFTLTLGLFVFWVTNFVA